MTPVPGQMSPPAGTARRAYDWPAGGWRRHGSTAYIRLAPEQVIARHVADGVPYYELWLERSCVGRYLRADEAVWVADYLRAEARGGG